MDLATHLDDDKEPPISRIVDPDRFSAALALRPRQVNARIRPDGSNTGYALFMVGFGLVCGLVSHLVGAKLSAALTIGIAPMLMLGVSVFRLFRRLPVLRRGVLRWGTVGERTDAEVELSYRGEGGEACGWIRAIDQDPFYIIEDALGRRPLLVIPERKNRAIAIDLTTLTELAPSFALDELSEEDWAQLGFVVQKTAVG